MSAYMEIAGDPYALSINRVRINYSHCGTVLKYSAFHFDDMPKEDFDSPRYYRIDVPDSIPLGSVVRVCVRWSTHKPTQYASRDKQ